MKGKLFKLVSILAIISMMVMPASAKPAQVILDDNATISSDVQYTGNYIIVFTEPGVVEYRGGMKGLEATAPAEGMKLDSRSTAAVAYKEHLESNQNTYIANMEMALGHELTVLGRLHYGVSGATMPMSDAEAAKIERMPYVKAVYKETLETLDTDAGPTWIGAKGIWDGTSVPGGVGTMGAGLVAGLIDSGINADHPSFADIGGDGYNHTNPWGAGVYGGVCDPADPKYDTSFVCNDKLIAGYEFSYYYYTPGPGLVELITPEDEHGHGSHTSSTVAGNVVTSTLGTSGVVAKISGVAPHANLIMYDACYANNNTGGSSCPGGALADSVDQSIADGVDVLSYSISGGTNPAGDLVEQLFGLSAYYNGTFISTSAGNSGPTASTVAHRSPWVSTVAASTHNRKFTNSLINMSGGTTPPGDMTGAGLTVGYGPQTIVYAGDYYTHTAGTIDLAMAKRCAPGYFTPGTFSGQIVVCDRGVDARVDKAKEVARVGAGGFVLANVAPTDSVVNDIYVIPGVLVNSANGTLLRTWLATSGVHTATIAGAVRAMDDTAADIIASFSSRGPDTTFDLLKPDITTPGVDIWAAVNTVNPLDPPEYSLMSGTSMAAPHTAGAGLLLRALHPTWTHSQIRSALQLTSQPYVWPYSINASGSGRVDLGAAANTGFTMHQSTGAMYNYVYAGLGEIRAFNLPSIMDTKCVVNCTWTRTVVSQLAVTATYTTSFELFSGTGFNVTVSPATFDLGPGKSKTLSFTMDVSALAVNAIGTGMVWFGTSTAGVPDMHIPVYAKAAASNLPSKIIEIADTPTAGTIDLSVVSIAAPDLTSTAFGLAEGVQSNFSLVEDPTNGTPYDVITGTQTITVTVPAGTKRLVAEIVDSPSSDLDMFVGLDDGDGIAEAGEVKCTSATGEVLEYCNINNPVAGTYWVLVQNWQASAVGVSDFVILTTGVVPTTDEGNMVITTPISATVGVPYPVTIDYTLDGTVTALRYYGAFSLGTTAATPSDLGTTLVDIRRTYPIIFLPLIVR